MRNSVVLELLVAAALDVVAAQETTSLFLPYFSPGHTLLASVVDAVSIIFTLLTPSSCKLDPRLTPKKRTTQQQPTQSPAPFTSPPSPMAAASPSPSISPRAQHSCTQQCRCHLRISRQPLSHTNPTNPPSQLRNPHPHHNKALCPIRKRVPLPLPRLHRRRLLPPPLHLRLVPRDRHRGRADNAYVYESADIGRGRILGRVEGGSYYGCYAEELCYGRG